MIDNAGNARWIAIVGVFVIISACAACALLALLLSSAYGGQTVVLRNPFAAPTQINSVNNSGGSTGGTTSSGGQVSGGGTGGTTSGGGQVGGGSTGNTTAPATLLPTLSGYTTANTSSISGALNLITSGGGFGAQSADPNAFSAQSVEAIVTSVLVSRLDEFIGCYQRSGAIDARIYIKADVVSVLSGAVPPIGAVAIINQDRLQQSLISCAVSPNSNTFSAQSVQLCGNYGSFSSAGSNYTYLYAGTAQEFCTAVQSHYAAFGG